MRPTSSGRASRWRTASSLGKCRLQTLPAHCSRRRRPPATRRSTRSTAAALPPHLHCTYGHLTWEWAAGLRSYAHPLLFAAPYATLKALGLDSAWAVVRVPLLLQALAAAATDVYVVKLARHLLGQQAARWGSVETCPMQSEPCTRLPPLLLSTTHWPALVRCRTGGAWSASWPAGSTATAWFAPTPTAWRRCSPPLECITGCSAKAVVAPAAAPAASAAGSSTSSTSSSPVGGLRPPRQRAWLACAALSVVFRPSSALFWTLPAALQLLQQQGRGLVVLLWDAATVGGGLLAAAALVDRVGYGR